jgi:hypothetical protein
MPLIERAFRAKMRFLSNPADIYEKRELTPEELREAQKAAFRAAGAKVRPRKKAR